MNIKILLSGDGGQGVQLMADIFGRAVFASGLHVTSIENYGLEQRGGVSLNFLQISDKKIVYPKFSKPNILLILSEQARKRTKRYENAECRILNIEDYKEKLLVYKIAKKSWNIFFLGMLAKELEEKNMLNREHMFELLEQKLKHKSNWEENKKTFELGAQE